MPGSKYSEKQMKIARVAAPRDAITGADFEAMNNSKMGGGMIKYSEGGDIRKEMLTQMLEDARESGDDDKIIEIEAELFQMGDGEGMMMGGMDKFSTKNFLEFIKNTRWMLQTSQNMFISCCINVRNNSR